MADEEKELSLSPCIKTSMDICDLGVEVRCLSDIAFLCSSLYGEREKGEAPPVINEIMENVFLGISCYAKRIADNIAVLDSKRGQL